LPLVLKSRPAWKCPFLWSQNLDDKSGASFMGQAYSLSAKAIEAAAKIVVKINITVILRIIET